VACCGWAAQPVVPLSQGEEPLPAGGDDWEPDVAANGIGHVYVAWTHFVGDTKCDPAPASSHSTYISEAHAVGGAGPDSRAAAGVVTSNANRPRAR
jgi:hypothetical protein